THCLPHFKAQLTAKANGKGTALKGQRPYSEKEKAALSLKVELVPLSIRRFPWAAGGQRNQPQAQRGFRIAPVAAQLLIELLDLLSRHRRFALAERHAQQPAQAGNWIGLDQTPHHGELKDRRQIAFNVNGRPRTM